MEKEFIAQVRNGEKFEFGKNWQSFLSTLNKERFAIATNSIQQNIGYASGKDKKFIDVGSGSGLFSLTARKLGYNVLSFDFDKQSVECTKFLKEEYFQSDANWKIAEGSVLDKSYLNSLGEFDVVYSWGVLHHTGSMWKALANVIPLVNKNGYLFISIYNDQGWKSKLWRSIKKIYNKSFFGKYIILSAFVPTYLTLYFFQDILRFRNPLHRYPQYQTKRGMSLHHDWIDWLGGYPFEVATPKAIFDFYKSKGFALEKLRTTNSSGCNEYVFKRII
ncbi:MAG: class I SAM-dependent methyltransferase [Flavobacterium sp.]|nr:MAG: class I SAM-dependent methyltransferase [Flavobacterium sp.]